MSGCLNGEPFGNMVKQIWSPTGELLTIKHIRINATVIGDNTIVAAVPDKKILVLSMFFLCSVNAGVRFESGAGGTALTGVMSFLARGGIALPYSPSGWLETAADAALNLELSGTSAVVSGSLQYVEIV